MRQAEVNDDVRTPHSRIRGSIFVTDSVFKLAMLVLPDNDKYASKSRFTVYTSATKPRTSMGKLNEHMRIGTSDTLQNVHNGNRDICAALKIVSPT